jgi:hypothetical protein
MFTRPDNWKDLTWQQKRDLRLNHWIKAEGVKFVSKEAEKHYKDSATRLAKAVKMELPDRVPCMIPTGWYPAMYANVPLK